MSTFQPAIKTIIAARPGTLVPEYHTGVLMLEWNTRPNYINYTGLHPSKRDIRLYQYDISGAYCYDTRGLMDKDPEPIMGLDAVLFVRDDLSNNGKSTLCTLYKMLFAKNAHKRLLQNISKTIDLLVDTLDKQSHHSCLKKDMIILALVMYQIRMYCAHKYHVKGFESDDTALPDSVLTRKEMAHIIKTVLRKDQFYPELVQFLYQLPTLQFKSLANYLRVIRMVWFVSQYCVLKLLKKYNIDAWVGYLYQSAYSQLKWLLLGEKPVGILDMSLKARLEHMAIFQSTASNRIPESLLYKLDMAELRTADDTRGMVYKLLQELGSLDFQEFGIHVIVPLEQLVSADHIKFNDTIITVM